MRSIRAALMTIGFVTIGLVMTGSEVRGLEQSFTSHARENDSRATTTSSENHRLVWEQGERLCRFVDKGEEGWVELDKDGKVFLQFKEMRRNIDFVELFDQKRGYLLRLYKDGLFVKGGRDGFHKFDEFTRLYEGQWVK